MALLSLLVDDVVVNKWELDGIDVLIMGRAADCDIQIDDQAVSSKHARIVREDDPYLDGAKSFYLEDLKSTNGTRLNGVPANRQKLSSGDLIELGYNKFRFVDDNQIDLEKTAVILPQ